MAIKKVYELSVDLKRTSVRVNIPVLVQGDSAEFRIRLLDNGAELSTEQLTGITKVSMQSGYDAQTVIQTVGTLQGSVAVFRLKKNELFRAGTVQAMVQLEDSTDRISTLRFQYQVIPELAGNYIPGEQDITVFQRYMNDAQAKIDEMAATDVAQLTVKLAEKVGGGVKLEPEELSDRSMALVTGQGAVNVLSRPQIGSVTPDVTTFLKTGENYFNEDVRNIGYALGVNGELVSNTTYDTSDFILLTAGTYNLTTCRTISIYDITQEHEENISIGPPANYTLVLETTSYIRVSFQKSVLKTAMIVKGALPSMYIPYRNTLTKNNYVTSDNILGFLPKEKLEFIKTKNLFNKNAVTKDYLINVDNGQLVQSSLTIDTYSVSEPMRVSPSNLALTRNRNVALYDLDNKFIQAYNADTRSLAVAIEGYIRISFHQEDLETTMVQVGDELGDYEDFGVYKFDSNIKFGAENLAEDLQSLFPSPKTSIHFGDSITANGKLVQKLAELTGYTTHNFAVGATRLIDLPNPANGYQNLGFLNLLRAKISGDWTVVDAAVADIDDPAVTERMTNFKNIDMSTVDYLSFMFGTNDINTTALVLGDAESTDTLTVNGATNAALEMIVTNYPHIKVYAFSSIFRPEMPGSNPVQNSDEFAKNGSIFLHDIAEAIGERAKAHKVPFKNMYYESGINKFNWTHWIDDGTHPNELGDGLVAEAYGRFMMSN